MHKVLSNLEDLLNEMKTDVARLPASLGRHKTVTEKLNMAERTWVYLNWIALMLSLQNPESSNQQG
jgi:hypothetical protein